ncbi:phosphomannomutase/phosphoglucomutase [Candidimonas humi]|uniref:Phosphomannomutase/phosphoglucomutase n=1 Tax=Candidimonas humi TaxID=683355 RepID=A0ABV8P1Z3_9BURK|nr:phosphomannomutase/phosphoglucomutase [Candidimonas humi]MBV6306196.1 phosphomannomutase/phosphoglucomutase [Candidimonas humi]
MSSRSLAPEVFKAYDIRGIVPGQIDAAFARRLGLALGRRAAAQGLSTVAVGHDGRLSSPELARALRAGLAAAGVRPLDAGLVPTPLVYFAACTLARGSGVAVTGSHNPPQYNGFKMMLGGQTLHGAQIQELHQAMMDLDEDAADGLDATANEAAAAGESRLPDLIDTYIARISGDVKLARPMKIAIDCGNGVGGVAAARLFKAMGCEVDELYCEVDGNFPNHHPDPAEPANLADLIAHVRGSDCELGLAFDGDADRLGVVTRSGQIIWPDRQLILFARDILQREPGSTIIFDVKCSRHVAAEIAKAGGQPLMWRTGHSLMKAKLAETGAPLAGEMSGHVFFKERWYGFDDGLYTGARLLEILSRSANPSEELEALPQGISTPELKLEMREGEPQQLVARLQGSAAFATARELVTIDGVRAEYEDGFGLARASNTTPVVVLRFEGDSEQALRRIQEEFRQALLALAPEARLPF